MKITILVQDTKGADEAERMNMPFEPETFHTTFYFRIDMLESMWVDEKYEELILGINGSDYRTPYSKELFETFKDILC